MSMEMKNEVSGPEEQGLGSTPEEICRKYCNYHAAWVVGHLFIEDADAQRGEGVLYVFLDD
jgi:hypothetical protein